MQTLLQLQTENKALSLALQLAVTALRLAPTCAMSDDAWPECSAAALNRARVALVPLMGYSGSIRACVESMGTMSDDQEDQDQLLMRWGNLNMSTILLISSPTPV